MISAFSFSIAGTLDEGKALTEITGALEEEASEEITGTLEEEGPLNGITAMEEDSGGEGLHTSAT
jgi:hypothetical protein